MVYLVKWLPALCWMGMIFFLSHMGGGESGRLSEKIVLALADFGFDLRLIFGDFAGWVVRKLAHMTEYAILFFLLMIPLWSKSKGIFWAFILAALYSASDEIHQSFIPGRVPAIQDVGIDTLGALLSALLVGGIRRFQASRVSASSQEK